MFSFIQYDVREAASDEAEGRGAVRNLGKPVALAQRYYEEGADEVVILNITSFRQVYRRRTGSKAKSLEKNAHQKACLALSQEVLGDSPMLQVLELASEHIFVPLTVGGGIRGYTDSTGREWSALEVAARCYGVLAVKGSLLSCLPLSPPFFFSFALLTGTVISCAAKVLSLWS